MNSQPENTDRSTGEEAEPSRRFVVEPTVFMAIMSERGTNNIRRIYFLFRNIHLWSLELQGGSVVTVDHGAKDPAAMLKDDEENGLAINLIFGEVPVLDSQEVSSLFHTLWSKAVNDDDYDKKQWMKLDQILRERGFDL